MKSALRAKFLFFSLLQVFILASCSTPSVISIKSDPEGAEVYVKNMDSKSQEKIGNTPLLIKGDELEKKKLKEGPLVVILTKQGFDEKKILLSETTAVDIEVSMKLTPTDRLANAKQVDDLSGQLFEVQRYIRLKEFQEALKLVDKLKKDYPEISVPNELEGSIHYLTKDYKKSHDAFSLAYVKNPENTFALKMKRALEQKLKKAK